MWGFGAGFRTSRSSAYGSWVDFRGFLRAVFKGLGLSPLRVHALK